MSKNQIWIVIAAYNESQIISSVIEDLLSCNKKYNIILVDDCSYDDTAAVAQKYNITILKHPINLGQGAALSTGIKYALAKKADIIITYDGDGQMQPQDIENLVLKLESSDYDVVLGSRFLDKKPEGITKIKSLVLRMATIFTRLSTGLILTDTHNGLRAFKADAARKIKITQNQMAHASEILSEIAKKKLTYCEVPVTIKYTEYSKNKGQSILNSFNILYDLLTRIKK